MTFVRHYKGRSSKLRPDKIRVTLGRITFPHELLQKHNPEGHPRVAIYASDKEQKKDYVCIGFQFTAAVLDSYKLSGKDTKTIEPYAFWRWLDPEKRWDRWQGNHQVVVLDDSDHGRMLVIRLLTRLDQSAKTE